MENNGLPRELPLLPADAESDGRSDRSRLYAVAHSLLRVHFEIAEAEAARDQKRLVRGAVLLGVAVFFLGFALIVGQGLGVWLLHSLGLSWGRALGAVAGFDLTFGLLLVFLGTRTLRQPVLPQTRAVLKRTLGALLSP